VNYSNTAVMQAQKLETHQEKPFMNRKITIDNEQNIEQNR